MKLNNRRSCVGPRGGRMVMPTPCADCVSWESCRPQGVTAALGCDQWADAEGHRVDPEADAARILGDDESQEVYCRGCANLGSCNVVLDPGEPCEDMLDDATAGEPVLTPYVDPPAPFKPDELGDRQGVLPMPDAGPLFSKG